MSGPGKLGDSDSALEFARDWDLGEASGPDVGSLGAGAFLPAWNLPEGSGEKRSLDDTAEGLPEGVALTFPGCAPGALDVTRSAPGWIDPAGVPPPAHRDADFPRIGGRIGHFQLIDELGRGSFARVYLALQGGDLADRPVALKVTPIMGEESRTLARLQHAHIVPIYSVHDDEATGLRLICMPYFGGANLARVLQDAGTRTGNTAGLTGRSLVDVLERAGRAGPERPTLAPLAGEPDEAEPGEHNRFSLGASLWVRRLGRVSLWSSQEDRDENRPEGREDEPEPNRRFLSHASYVQAAAWIIARLAEALEHAHSRGVLHRDLKPSNILIAGDGTPMLLDFNLSAIRPVDAIDTSPDTTGQLGGTLAYMAPEHLDAFHPRGKTAAEDVGPAADLYALGLILFEMVTGAPPFVEPPNSPITEAIESLIAARRQGVPSARELNPQVPWGLESILRKCLAFDPNARYGHASELAEDLRRFLDDQPLQFAPELSLKERAAKWARRHPRAASSTTVGTLAVTLLLILGAISGTIAGRMQRAEAQGRFAWFQRQRDDCLLQLNTDFGGVSHLDQGITQSDAVLAAYGVGRGKPREWLESRDVRLLAPDDRNRLAEGMSVLVQLRARARIYEARGRGASSRLAALEEAVAWLNRAEQFDPRPSFALYDERAHYFDAMGDRARALADRALASKIPPETSRDFTLLGTALLALGEADRAEQELTRAVTADPNSYWASFALGLCHLKQNRPLDAAYDFGGCTRIAPWLAWGHVNRGVALASAGRLAEARVSYDQAVAVDPQLVAARVNRALVCLELDDAASALIDLDAAIELGRQDAAILAARAEALARLGRRLDAQREFAKAIALQPNNAELRVARGTSRLGFDPEGARGDFERALELSPEEPRALLGLARLARETDLDEARALLDRALARAPEFSDALQLRALVLASQGDRLAERDVDALEQVPTPHRLYNAACALARLSRATGESRYLTRARLLRDRAIAVGFPEGVAAADPDLSDLPPPEPPRVVMPGRAAPGA